MENKHLIIIILVLAIIEVCIMGGYAFYVGTSHEDTNNIAEDDNNSYEINSTNEIPDVNIVEETNNENFEDEGLSPDGYSYYPTSKNAPDVDRYGITREYAIAHNMHYIHHVIDNGEDVGGYTAYDTLNGGYHT